MREPRGVLTYRIASCGGCHVSHICPLRCVQVECEATRMVHFIALAGEIDVCTGHSKYYLVVV
jgi:hypothetical protein